LKGFSGIETVSRDGSGTYKKAFNEAFPAAEQISDRFHLVKNLVEAAQGYFAKIIPYCIVPPKKGANILGISGKMNSIERAILERYKQKQKVFLQVKRLQAKGKAAPTVSRELGLAIGRVEKYFGLDTLPLHGQAMTERASKFQPFKPLVINLIKQGKRTFEIVEAVKNAGCESAVSRIRGYVSKVRRDGADHTEEKFYRRDVCKLLYRPPEKIKDERLRGKVEKYVAENPQVALIIATVNEFREILKGGKPDALDDWTLKVKTLKIKELTGFANYLEGDLPAVKNAIIYHYSNGIAEGKINKLKTIKRQIYGRAGFELLTSRLFLSDLFSYVE
jgi:transposase